MATKRFLEMTAVGGKDVVLTSFEGQESLSRLFSYQLEFVSPNLDISPAQAVGRPVRVTMDRGQDAEGNARDPRYFSGYISRMWAGDALEVTTGEAKGSHVRNYRAEMVPWLWFLTQAARCHIFFPEKESKTVYEVVEQIFKRAEKEFHFKPDVELAGISDLNQRKLTHCVQYRETDYNFLARLLEQFGVFYYFRHTENGHTLVLECNKKYPPCEEKEVDYPQSVSQNPLTDRVTDWERQYEFVSGKWEHTDYNFETPTTKLAATSSKHALVNLPANSGYELYDYPGEYTTTDDGLTDADVRMQEEEVAFNVVQGASTCKTFTPGHQFKLKSHPSFKQEAGKNYTVTSISHRAAQPGPESSTASVGTQYSNAFSCIPADIQFRPARITPKPTVSGIQTAVVVGPPDEEIYTDKYGRVKVVFHWDRDTKKKETTEGDKCSCWIRTSNSVAGNRWGFVAIPRIGQEVVVEFVDGDPDRPLITGSVYNADQQPHYDLPEHKSRTYLKTNSTLGGEGYNELMFEDLAGEERVFLHAQKNLDMRVRNDATSRIYGNRFETVGWEKDGNKGGDQRELVYEDKHQTVKRHQFEHIEGNLQLMVGHGEADEGGDVDIVIEKQKSELIEGDSHLVVKGNHLEQVDGKVSQTVGGDWHTKANGNIAHEAGASGEIHLKSGMKIILEAGSQLSLVGPGGFVDIGPAGVTIQGTTVKINSGGAAGSGSGCQPDAPEEPEQAAPAQPGLPFNSESGKKSAKTQ